MTDPDEARSGIRRRVRAARRDLSAAERLESDRRIQGAVLELIRARSSREPAGGAAALSLPTDGEVDLTGLFPELRRAGWTITLPVVGGAGPTMRFVVWTAEARLRPNRFGIDEPEAGLEVPIADLDVVVVPAVAVDADGHRLGFGGGFYDRALADRRPDTLLVAAVHDVQLIDRVPAADHDVRMDVVVTPSRTIRIDRSGD